MSDLAAESAMMAAYRRAMEAHTEMAQRRKAENEAAIEAAKQAALDDATAYARGLRIVGVAAFDASSVTAPAGA